MLKDSDSVYVKFNGENEGRNWNIRVDWANYENGVLWRAVDLCTVATLTLLYDKDAKVTSFKAE